MKSLLIAFLLLTPPLASAEGIGSISSISGDATLSRGKSKITIELNQEIMIGDLIELSKGAAAKIDFKNGNTIHLKSKTRFKVKSYPKAKADKTPSAFDLIYGTVRALVKKKSKDYDFRVTTPSSVTGVRGTDFLLSYDPTLKEATCITFEGVVEFSNLGANGKAGKTVRLSAGQSSSVVGKSAPSGAKPLPKKKLDKLQKSTMVKAGMNEKGPRGKKKQANDTSKNNDGSKAEMKPPNPLKSGSATPSNLRSNQQGLRESDRKKKADKKKPPKGAQPPPPPPPPPGG